MAKQAPSVRCPVDGCPIDVRFITNGLDQWSVCCESRIHLCDDRWMCPLNQEQVKLDMFGRDSTPAKSEQ